VKPDDGSRAAETCSVLYYYNKVLHMDGLIVTYCINTTGLTQF